MNVLFLTHRLPYAPNRGDRNRAYHLLRQMSRFADVSLFSLVHDDEEAAHISEVPFATTVETCRVPRRRNLALGLARLPTSRPLTHSLLDAPQIRTRIAGMIAQKRPDVVMAFCSGMARFALEPPLETLPLVIDMVDVDSAKWDQLALKTRAPLRWIYRREARTLAAFERKATLQADSTLVVNERERLLLTKVSPTARVLVMQNGIAIEEFAPGDPPIDSPVVVFCGVMNYYPNEEGVLWFGQHVWPKVCARRPDAKFMVVGSSPTRAIRRLSEVDPSIDVVGRVPLVQPYLHHAAVAVAPLRLARGVQTKVIEALAARLPVVVTSAVMGGLPPEAGPGCIVRDDEDTFAVAVADLLNQESTARRRLAESAHLEALTWDAQTRDLQSILERAIVQGRSRA